MGRAGEQPAHPEARTIRRNAILCEELVPVVSPFGSDEENTRNWAEMWRERVEEGGKARERGDFGPSEGQTRTISAFSLVLGKKPRYRPNLPTKRVPPSSQYTFLESNPPLPPLPDPIPPQNTVPMYVNLPSKPAQPPQSPYTGLIRGVVFCLGSVSGSDVYVIDVVEVSSDLPCIFQRARKDRLTLVHRSRSRIGAGSAVLIVGPVCIDATSLFFVAEKVLPAQPASSPAANSSL